MTTIKAIEYHFPTNYITNDPNNKLTKKLGISTRYIAEQGETASDLAIQAAEKLFAKGICQKGEIDFYFFAHNHQIIFCRQQPVSFRKN